MHISNLERTEPDSQILYRLKYRAEVAEKVQVFFVVELDPLGGKSVYWDAEPAGLSASEQEQVLKTLQDLAEHDKLPR